MYSSGRQRTLEIFKHSLDSDENYRRKFYNKIHSMLDVDSNYGDINFRIGGYTFNVSELFASYDGVCTTMDCEDNLYKTKTKVSDPYWFDDNKEKQYNDSLVFWQKVNTGCDGICEWKKQEYPTMSVSYKRNTIGKLIYLDIYVNNNLILHFHYIGDDYIMRVIDLAYKRLLLDVNHRFLSEEVKEKLFSDIAIEKLAEKGLLYVSNIEYLQFNPIHRIYDSSGGYRIAKL